jgi:hypothetical protein
MCSWFRRRGYSCIKVAIFLAVTLSANLYAQTVTATLSGIVKDVQDAAIGNVSVTVTNTATSAVRKLQTDSTGRYEANALQPGPYTVFAEMPGFSSKTITGLTLNVGDVRDLPIVLNVGGVNDAVSVSAVESSLQTETSSNGVLIDNKQVVELPLANRQFYNLALLSPAAYQPAQNSTLGFRGGINIAGATEISNEFTVNGVYNNDMGTAQPSFRPSVEVIQEFQLLTGVYPAEYGQMSGGHLVIITKSGTNAFHGSAYEFIRNEVTDAKNYFTLAGSKTPSFKQNTFGATIGGPIIKDKFFFFFGYEGQRIRQAVTALATVPTQAMIAGTFTSETLYDPNTGLPLPVNSSGSINLTTALGAEPINWNTTAAQAGQLIANLGFPAPTNASASNYNFNEIRSENMNEYAGRFDGKLSEKDSLNFSYNAFIDPAFEPSNSLCSSYVLPNFGCYTNQISTLINLTYQRIFTPNLINNLTIGYQRLQQPRVQQDNTSIGSKYPGLPGGPYFTQANYANNLGLPNTAISGYSTIGGATNLPQNRWDSHYQITDAVTWTHHAHTIKAGTDLLLTRAINLITSDGRGAFSVNDASIYGLSGKSTRLGSTGDSLADFLLGLTYTSTIGPTAANVYLNFQSQDFFVQDDWKIRPNLTLNLGLRYELDHPVDSPNNSVSNFSLTQQQYNQAGVNGNPKGLYSLDANNIAPRVGFSYSPFEGAKTVIKGAGGLFYNMPLLYNQFLTNGTQAPFRFVSTYTSVASAPGKINTIELSSPFTIPNTAAPTPCVTGIQTGCSASLAALHIQPGYRTPYLSEWSFGVEQALTKSFVFETTYFGSKGSKLPLSVPVNVVNPATYVNATRAPNQSDRPFPNFGVITSQDTNANSEFHSWQNSLKQTYSNGVSFLLAYTWGKSIDGGGGIGSGSNSSGTVQNVYNLRGDRGLSDFDVRHRIVFSPVAELPFGRNKPYFNQGLESAILGGFQLSGIFSWQTGRPFTITDSSSNNSGYYESADRPNIVAGQNPNNGPKTVAEWFNTAAFALAPSFTVKNGVVTQVGQFGNAGRNIVEGPSYTDLDLTLARAFPIHQRINGQFRVETFNILNHPNFFNPLTTGTQLGSGASFGQITQANTPRQLQFSLRILF